MREIYILALFAFVLTACASSGQGTAQKSSFSRNIITAEQIATTTAQNAYQVIQNLRPQWLILRAESPVVYSDRLRLGRLSALETVYATDIEKIEYLRHDEATFQFGTGHTGGAFLITTKAN